MPRSVLIVDDEKSIRLSLSGILQDEGFEVFLAKDGEEALDIADRELPDLILLDIWLPGMDGIEALKRMKTFHPEIPIIMISGHGTIETAVKATKLGAYDFIEKPLSLDKVLLVIENTINYQKLEEENKQLKQKTLDRYELTGESETIILLKKQIKIAGPTNAWVLITGENGTGKELVARAIHRESKRVDKPFIEVNCAAMPEELIESELFGHEKGAFTGAISSKKGKFDLANGGTLFLDEIGDMSLKTQAKILRVLQEQRFTRVGGTRLIQVDVRVIAATNKELGEEIKRGNFREDLYYRLNVVPLHIPPLRERKGDIPLLVETFLKEFSRGEKRIALEAMDLLILYDWPGNVRELKNMIERLVILSILDEIIYEDVSFYLKGPKREKNEELSLKEARKKFEKDFIIQKLKESQGNITKTADILGIERSNLHRKVKSFGIELGRGILHFHTK